MLTVGLDENEARMPENEIFLETPRGVLAPSNRGYVRFPSSALIPRELPVVNLAESA